jgi:general secretion pathway protein G
MRKAFTMVELVFVIVVIGILSAIAVPKFAATRDDAVVSKGRAAVAAMRSAIAMERQKRILRGDFDDISGDEVEDLLDYNLSEQWSRSGDTFTFKDPSSNECDFDVEHNKLVKKDCDVDGMSDL